MYKDYSGSMIAVSGRNKIITSKRKNVSVSHELLPTTRVMWKTIGAMLLLTLVIGISSTIWYGLQVQVALDQIGSSAGINNELQNENKLLLAQRNLMLTTDHMRETAQKIGLVSPTENQLRYR
jgi:predicted RNA-binding protein (virulence factor B family)